MTTYYENIKGNTIKSKLNIKEKIGDFIYFVRLINRESGDIEYKIGTTNDLMRRLKEHIRYYKYRYDIEILWVSPPCSKYTTLRIEDRQKKWWIENTEWEYIRNDRFRIPNTVKEIVITIKKDYIIEM